MAVHQLELFTELKPREFRTINTIQYLGSKKELLSWIIPAIERSTDPGDIILDLFAGTGSVSYALKERNIIFANDIQKYSYIINKSLFGPLDDYNAELFQQNFTNDYYINFTTLCNHLGSLLEIEDKFLNAHNDDLYKQYQDWCDNTPFRYCNFSHIPNEFKSLQDLIDEIDNNNRALYCLFTVYYSNAYFSLKQCIQIDSLRFAINGLPEDLQNVAFTALMSAMSYTVTSTTHFAQFLKVKNKKTFKHIREKRKQDLEVLFWSKFQELLSKLYEVRPRQENQVINKDYKEIFEDENILHAGVKLVYADPPYFKEHYSRYYHVIENLISYDYPTLTFNPRIGSVTVGRYSEDRFVSDFGKKSIAPKAFEILAAETRKLGAKLFISYSNNSIVSLENITDICNKYFSHVSVETFDHIHSKQGRKEACLVQEYLIKCEI